jgi:hypothetical protein
MKKSTKILAIVILVASLSALAGLAIAARDRFMLTAPNGVAFSEFRGYDTWQDVAVSATDHCIKAILGNPAMINAYKGRHSGQWQAFPRRRANCKDRVDQETEHCLPLFCGGAWRPEISFVHREGFQDVPGHERAFSARYPRELIAAIAIRTKGERVFVKEQHGYEGG